MKQMIQANYEARLSRYAALIHGNEPPGLVAKLAIYSALLGQHERLGDRLWQIEPLLFPLVQSAETDLHLATARLLEDPRRSDRSLFDFLIFCIKNRANISWQAGAPPADLLEAQLERLETHRDTIARIMSRRDKFFAHLDKKYFADPAAIYADFPLSGSEVIALVNCVIKIISEHEWNLRAAASLHVAEFYEVAVDNMVRNLDVGRKTNFPGQLG